MQLAKIAAVAFLFAPPAIAEEAPPNLREALTEARWVNPDTDLLAFLSTSPGECLREPADDEARYLVEVGRAAFRSPLLFGGTAARSGLSCESCHRDGRGNPDFFLAGLSGEAGEADVTSSLFSKTREDGVFNPAPIPSLVGAGGKAQFGTRAPKPTLHAFIEGAVEDEFQGAPPPRAIVDGIAAYVSHLDETACPEGGEPQMARRAMADVGRALEAARGALAREDAAAADFLVLAAQHALRPVFERYAGPRLTRERAAIEALARDIGAIRALVSAEPEEARARLILAQASASGLARRLNNRSRKSLYDMKVLKGAIEGPIGEQPGR